MTTITGTNADNSLSGTADADDIFGLGRDDLVDGLGGNDVLDGGPGDDTLVGNGGDDRLIGGAGVNELTGGPGADVFAVSDRQDAHRSEDRITDFEIGDDRLDLSAWGVSGIEQIRIILDSDNAGHATFNAIFRSRDHIVTLEGIDPDELGAGDFIFSSTSDSWRTGTNGTDILFGSAGGGAGTLEGRGGADMLIGGYQDNPLNGDRLDGGGGDDHLFGSPDNDIMYGLGGADILVGRGGDDSLYAHNGNDIVLGGKGFDLIFGGGGADRMYGGSGPDIIYGGVGSRDLLSGGSGGDILNGESGTQVMIGGSGADSFRFDLESDAHPHGKRDKIRDFEQGTDVIDLKTMDASKVVAGNQKFAFVGTQEFSDFGQLRYLIVGDRTVVQANTRQDLAPDFEIKLDGQLVLTAADFVL